MRLVVRRIDLYDGDMSPRSDNSDKAAPQPKKRDEMGTFGSGVVDRIREAGNVWNLPAGQILLPRVFGFCRGVERALEMLERAVIDHADRGTRLFLLGEIIHNPWVNDHFRDCGVRILIESERGEVERFVGPEDCAVIPAFGAALPIEQRLRAIGCEIVDTSCGDVRRLWRWAERAVGEGFAVLIFGRAKHEETVVTKSRLAAAGGKYLVVGDLDEAEVFCRMIAGEASASGFGGTFDEAATNADSIEPFRRLAQVSQTTMLYDETMRLREALGEAFARYFRDDEVRERLLLQPTVCRATQDRQAAAIEMCESGLDVAIVVGGFGSSNTRHLYELARRYSEAYFIEGARSIRSEKQLNALDLTCDEEIIVRDWVPLKRPVRIGILAGASTPESVVGQVLQRLAAFLR